MQLKRIGLWIGICALGLGRGVWAQTQATSVSGQIQGDDLAADHAVVTLLDFTPKHLLEYAEVRADGTFQFRDIPFGEYRLTVSVNGDQPVEQQMVSISGENQFLAIYLKQHKTRPPAGEVSVKELMHPPAKKAVDAVRDAQKLSFRGKHELAAARLEKAVQLSPDYPTAWINLAAQHLHMGRYRDALRELDRASQIGAPSAILFSDRAFAEYSLGQNEEATRSARAAIRIDPSYSPAQYLLGSYLARASQTRAEGVEHLRIAAQTMPSAQLELDSLLKH